MIDRHFTGTASRIGGVGLDVLARETLARHLRAYPEAETLLPVGGVYAWRRGGEHHQWNPESIAKLQHAVRHGGRQTYDEWAAEMNETSARRASLRGLIGFKFPENGGIAARRGRAGDARSSSASRPARCRSARCRARRTRRSRSP